MGGMGGMNDLRCSQLKRSHMTFASYPSHRSQHSKGCKRLHVWTEFNPKMTRKALWVNGWSTPVWVKTRLKLIAQGRLQSSAGYDTRHWSQDNSRGNDSRHIHRAGTTSEAIAVLKNRLQRGITTDSYTIC